METREYFEKVMQEYNQNGKGRSLRKYCKEEAVDYDWLIEFKKSYRSNQLQPDENKKLGEGKFIALTVEENFVPEKLNDINQLEHTKFLKKSILLICIASAANKAALTFAFLFEL